MEISLNQVSNLNSARLIVPRLGWNAECLFSVPDPALERQNARILSIVVELQLIHHAGHLVVEATLHVVFTSNLLLVSELIIQHLIAGFNNIHLQERSCGVFLSTRDLYLLGVVLEFGDHVVEDSLH